MTKVYIKNLNQLDHLLHKASGAIRPVIKKYGGRCFVGTYFNKPYSYSMKELMKKTLALAEAAQNSIRKEGLDKLRAIRDTLCNLNQRGHNLSKKTVKIQQAMTSLRSCFGGIGFNRKKTWEKINQIILKFKDREPTSPSQILRTPRKIRLSQVEIPQPVVKNSPPKEKTPVKTPVKTPKKTPKVKTPKTPKAKTPKTPKVKTPKEKTPKVKTPKEKTPVKESGTGVESISTPLSTRDIEGLKASSDKLKENVTEIWQKCFINCTYQNVMNSEFARDIEYDGEKLTLSEDEKLAVLNSNLRQLYEALPTYREKVFGPKLKRRINLTVMHETMQASFVKSFVQKDFDPKTLEFKKVPDSKHVKIERIYLRAR